MASFTVIDVETTGFSSSSRIVEIAAIRLENSEIKAELTTLLNPETEVGPTWVHGIEQHQVADAPKFKEIVGDLIPYLSGAVWAGHNIGFDNRFLVKELTRAGVGVPKMPTFCTYQAVRSLALKNHKLPAVCEYFGIELDKHHSALADARAAAQILLLLQAQGKLKTNSKAPVLVSAFKPRGHLKSRTYLPIMI